MSLQTEAKLKDSFARKRKLAPSDPLASRQISASMHVSFSQCEGTHWAAATSH